MTLILLEKFFLKNSFDITFCNFLEAVNIGTPQRKDIAENVSLEGLTHAVDVEEMSAIIKSFESFIIESTVADLAKDLFLFSSFYILFVQLLLKFSGHFHVFLMHSV